MTVRSAPQEQGASSATLQILSDDRDSPGTIGLSGTGGTLPTGATGAQGPPGAVEVMTCETTGQATGAQCTTRQFSGSVDFTGGSRTARVRLRRGHIRYAVGIRMHRAGDSSELVRFDVRPLRHGEYTLVTRTHRGSRWVFHHEQVTID